MGPLREGVYLNKAGRLIVATEWSHGSWLFDGVDDKRRNTFFEWKVYLITKCEYLGEL